MFEDIIESLFVSLADNSTLPGTMLHPRRSSTCKINKIWYIIDILLHHCEIVYLFVERLMRVGQVLVDDSQFFIDIVDINLHTIRVRAD